VQTSEFLVSEATLFSPLSFFFFALFVSNPENQPGHKTALDMQVTTSAVQEMKR